MKKTLIALAVAGAVSAPAFAATSNVDIYGVLNVSVSRIDTDVTGIDTSTSVSSNASRIGVKGSEDLGGGLSAIWQIETTVNADEGGGFGSGRNTFVGLKSGSLGTVLAGKHDTPVKLLGRKLDNFGDTLADSRNLLGADAVSGSSNFDLRTDNTIVYVSPSFSGLTVVGAYVADHNQTGDGAECSSMDCNVTDAWSVSADYANGPLMLGLGYEVHNVDAGASEIDRSMWRLVGGYSFGNFKLGAQYENGSGDVSLVPAVSLATADRNGWGLFANYAMGAITLKANYLSVGDYEGVDSSGAKQYTLGADYAMSKRTTVYALYAKLKNDSAAAFDLGRAQSVSDTTNTNNGSDPSVFGVGVKHTF